MSQFSNFLENKLFDETLRATEYTAPTTVWVALYTSDPTDADTGTEVSGGSYARKSVTFSAPSNGSATNSADVTFDVATANWGTITHIAIRDASTGGNALYHGALSTSKTVNNGDQIIFQATNITVTLA